MKKAAIINFKGGVGKTSLSFHLACFLSKTHKVLLIDVDHQSSLSLVVLGQSQWETEVSNTNTINKLFESFCNRKVSLPSNEIIIENPFNLRDSRYDLFPNLDFVAAQFELDDTEIDLASTNIGNASLSDWEKRTLIATWLDAIGAEETYDYVLFDCPPATKIISQNALSASDCYIVPVIPDELSSRGVTHFHSLVQRKIDEKLAFLRDSARVPNNQIPKNYVETTVMAAIAPSLVKIAGNADSGYTNIHTEQLSALRKKWGNHVLRKVNANYIGVPEAVNAGWPVWQYWGNNATDKVKKMMTEICRDIKKRIDAV